MLMGHINSPLKSILIKCKKSQIKNVLQFIYGKKQTLKLHKKNILIGNISEKLQEKELLAGEGNVNYLFCPQTMNISVKLDQNI